MGSTNVYRSKEGWNCSSHFRLSRTKQKDETTTVSDFKIQNLLLKLEGFKYGTALDLNMGYYHVKLSNATKELCTITTQWGKYEYYQRLPMGLCNSPDIFQEKMNDLLDHGLETVRVDINDILHVTKGTWEDYLTRLKEVFSHLQQAGLKVNAKKSNEDHIEASYSIPELSRQYQ
jgi:hypothetical protein